MQSPQEERKDGEITPLAPPLVARPTRMRALRLYLPLVGVPAIAVAAVLRAGKHLAAPPGIHGQWSVRQASLEPPLGSPRPTDAGCSIAVAADSIQRLVITQSGPRAEAAMLDAESAEFGRAALHVRAGIAVGPIRGTSVAAACASVGVLSLAFSGAVPDSMRATLGWPDCASCSALRFLAVRRPRRE